MGKQKQGEPDQAGGISPGQIRAELPHVGAAWKQTRPHLEARKPCLYRPRCKVVGRVSLEVPGGSSCEPLALTVAVIGNGCRPNEELGAGAVPKHLAHGGSHYIDLPCCQSLTTRAGGVAGVGPSIPSQTCIHNTETALRKQSPKEDTGLARDHSGP